MRSRDILEVVWAASGHKDSFPTVSRHRLGGPGTVYGDQRTWSSRDENRRQSCLNYREQKQSLGVVTELRKAPLSWVYFAYPRWPPIKTPLTFSRIWSTTDVLRHDGPTLCHCHQKLFGWRLVWSIGIPLVSCLQHDRLRDEVWLELEAGRGTEAGKTPKQQTQRQIMKWPRYRTHQISSIRRSFLDLNSSFS